MTQITLVLPFALPPPELAQDLLRVLKAPALAGLLSRPSRQGQAAADDTIRALPHEAWLARKLNLSGDGKAAFARAAMRGFGLPVTDGTWHIVNPTHIEISRSHLLMTDARQLQLSGEQSRALFDIARPYFEESGMALLYGDAHTWFLRADSWADLDTSTPDSAAGMNLTDWLPRGAQSVAYRKLQNEIQMLWFEHAVNSARESTGLATINGFWPWATAADAPPAPRALATIGAPSWIDALASHKDMAPADAAGLPDGAIVYCDTLSQWAIAAEWAGWLQHLQQLDETLLAPLLEAMNKGRIARLQLVLTRRERIAESSTSKMAQRQFWRRPTLDFLLP
jgi:hypothetical protein